MPFIYKSFLPSHLKGPYLSEKCMITPDHRITRRSSFTKSVFINSPLYLQHHTRLVRHKIILSYHLWPKRGLNNQCHNYQKPTQHLLVSRTVHDTLKVGYLTTTLPTRLHHTFQLLVTGTGRLALEKQKLQRLILKHLGKV